MKYKIGDRVEWKYLHYGNRTYLGCEVIEVSGDNVKIRDYDNYIGDLTSGSTPREHWVESFMIRFGISENRHKKLEELGL